MNQILIIAIAFFIYKQLKWKKQAPKIAVEKYEEQEGEPYVIVWAKDKLGNKAVGLNITEKDTNKNGEKITKQGGTTGITYRKDGARCIIVVTNEGVAVEENIYPDFATMFSNAKTVK